MLNGSKQKKKTPGGRRHLDMVREEGATKTEAAAHNQRHSPHSVCHLAPQMALKLLPM